jgi:hypothetical protein
MGWKRALVTLAANAKRNEREQLSQQRDYDRQLKQSAKLERLAAARLEVAAHEGYLAQITSVHRDCSEPYRWLALLQTPPPEIPQKTTRREEWARQELLEYRPNFFAKIFKTAQKKQKNLQEDIEISIMEDQKEYEKSMARYADDLEIHAENKDLAEKILSGDTSVYRDVIDTIDVFDEIKQIGSKISIQRTDPDRIEANIIVNEDTVVPTEEKKLLKSGNVSRTPIKDIRKYNLYQDYVCGSVLRVGREILALLPKVKIVEVKAYGKIMNTVTGHYENKIILSVLMDRKTMTHINFARADASDSMSLFEHQMNFDKKLGFRPIDLIPAPPIASKKTADPASMPASVSKKKTADISSSTDPSPKKKTKDMSRG